MAVLVSGVKVKQRQGGGVMLGNAGLGLGLELGLGFSSGW